MFARPSVRRTRAASIRLAPEPDLGSIHPVVSVNPRRQVTSVAQTLSHERTVDVLNRSIDWLDRLWSLRHVRELVRRSCRPNVVFSGTPAFGASAGTQGWASLLRSKVAARSQTCIEGRSGRKRASDVFRARVDRRRGSEATLQLKCRMAASRRFGSEE